jgi:hypothetical protein
MASRNRKDKDGTVRYYQNMTRRERSTPWNVDQATEGLAMNIWLERGHDELDWDDIGSEELGMFYASDEYDEAIDRMEAAIEAMKDTYDSETTVFWA